MVSWEAPPCLRHVILLSKAWPCSLHIYVFQVCILAYLLFWTSSVPATWNPLQDHFIHATVLATTKFAWFPSWFSWVDFFMRTFCSEIFSKELNFFFLTNPFLTDCFGLVFLWGEGVGDSSTTVLSTLQIVCPTWKITPQHVWKSFSFAGTTFLELLMWLK